MKHCKALRNRSAKTLISFFSLFLFSATRAFSAPTIGAITVNANPVAQYSLFELTFPITTWATNLYDPTQISVSATFTSPSGANTTINGFAYQGFNRTGSTGGINLTATGNLVWKVRFSPPASGTWSYTVTATDTGGTSNTTSSSFTVNVSANHGFIGISKVDVHYFAYSDGTAFFPVGENMDWPDENFDNNIYWYDDFMPKLAAQGGNWIRLWMSDWCFGIENAPGTLGNYANSQNQAWCLDYVMAEAAQYGIAVQLCLNYANQYTASYNDWSQNPYNSANGGPLTSDDQLWTNATAQAYMTQRWRYITARWGYATNLLDYELFNEVDHTDNSQTHLDNGDVGNWHNNNRNILNSLNPQTHMVSTSFDAYIASQQTTWANLDFTQWHSYGDYPSNEQSETSMIQQYLPTYRGYKNVADYAGEMGTNWVGPGQEATSDPNGVAIHEVNWASLMSNAAGGGFIWWWDNYVDPNNLYFNWKGISSFVAGEDLDKRAYSAKTGTPGNANGEPLTTLYMVGNQKAMGWVEDQNNQWAAKENGAGVGTASAATQQITGLSTNGTWQVQWWNTVTGVVASTQSVNVTGGTVTLNIPIINSTNPDWAFKMVPSAPVTASTWRVNAGGAQYTDCKSNVWAADENYVSGNPSVSTGAINSALPCATDQTLYQDQRYGPSFDYAFNVPAGSYQVTLKFAETYSGDFVKGARVFNVSINGTQVLTNFDIYATTGANTALDEVFNNIAPSGGTISIQFTGTSSTDTNAVVEALQIIPQPPTPTFTATSTKTNTPLPPTNTFTYTATKTNTPVPTNSFTSSPTRTFSPTATYTNSATRTDSMTPTASLTATPTNTNTVSSTPTFTNSPVPPTATFTFTATRSFTPSFTTTSTASYTSTSTSTATSTRSFTATSTTTSTNSSTPTSTSTATSTWTSTSSNTATTSPTASMTASYSPTSSATGTSTSTWTSTATATRSSTSMATATSTNSSTSTVTFTPTWTNTSTSTSSNTPSRTNTPEPPTATSSFTTTMTNTFTPSHSFTFTQTATSTPTFTATPTDSMTPTASRTATPSATPTRTSSFTPTRTNTPTMTLTFTPTAGTGCSGVPAWNGDFVYYGIGAKVTYNGELYQCQQAHTSETTWEPNVTPALWVDLGSCSTVKTAVIFPNPATTSNQVQLAVPLTGVSNVSVRIYTIGFRKVQERNFFNIAAGSELPLELVDNLGSKLANGLYYIESETQGHRWITKLLVIH